MMTSLRSALLAGAALLMPLAAHAQPVTGLYVGAGAGLNWAGGTDISFSGPGMAGLTIAQRDGEIDYDPGWAGVLSLGFGHGNGLRTEVELSYRQNDVDRITGLGNGAGFSSFGRLRSYGAMVNALYDFDFGMGLPLIPYVGIGGGLVMEDYAGVAQVPNAGGANVTRIFGSDLNFAYQAIVGASVPLNDWMPGLALTAEYRFIGVLEANVDAVRRVGAAGGPGQAEGSNYHHTVLLGVRYAFGSAPAPAPVVAPAAAPVVARTYLVFFDWNRADLTERAQQIIGEAAQNSTRVQTTRIEVSGHADRSGTPQYNQRLSERRAQAVAAELERRGVPRSAMVIQAFGESRPLVPTADGVREPQNRRVEIVLR
jgi:outer membrane protein OmpA-like peptidoglycan-associated protein